MGAQENVNDRALREQYERDLAQNEYERAAREAGLDVDEDDGDEDLRKVPPAPRFRMVRGDLRIAIPGQPTLTIPIAELADAIRETNERIDAIEGGLRAAGKRVKKMGKGLRPWIAKVNKGLARVQADERHMHEKAVVYEQGVQGFGGILSKAAAWVKLANAGDVPTSPALAILAQLIETEGMGIGVAGMGSAAKDLATIVRGLAYYDPEVGWASVVLPSAAATAGFGSLGGVLVGSTTTTPPSITFS